MLKILQARLQQYMNHELLYVKAGFRKGRGTRDQIANSLGKFKKKIFFFLNKFSAPFSLSLSFPSKTSVMQLLVHSLLYKSLKLPLLKQNKKKKQKKNKKKHFFYFCCCNWMSSSALLFHSPIISLGSSSLLLSLLVYFSVH